MNLMSALFSTNGFMPHGHCYLWQPSLVALHVASDACVALAYMTIPFTLLYLVRRRRDIPFDSVVWCFGTFIVACGATHAMEIWTLWHPTYWLSGGIKAITALASVPTAVLLVRQIPKMLAIPSQAELSAVNAALQKRQELFQTAIDASAEGLFVFEPLKDERGGVINFVCRDVNEAGARHLGKQREHVLGACLTELYNDDYAQLFHLMREVLRTQTPASYEATGQLDGQALWTDRNIVPFDRGLLMTCRDVTERRRLLQQVALAERLASIGTLAAGVAHEVNNPLAYIIGNLSFLEEGLQALSRGQAHPTLPAMCRALSETRQGADKVRTIVHDLKTFSRPETDYKGPVDVRNAIECAIRIADHETKRRAHVVRDFANVAAVAASSTRLCQVMVNLLLNAAHAIPEGTPHKHQITVRTRSMPGRRVAVEVRDDGCGIAPEHQRRIFDPFFTTKGLGLGTGLGLSICHGIVQRLGGDILVDSQLGHGSTFTVILPEADLTPVHAMSVSATTIDDHDERGRVLLIDDEPLMGSVIERLLAPTYRVDAVTQCSEGLARLNRTPPYDLIICDLMMPESSGVDFYHGVEQFAPQLLDRVVFLTGGTLTQPMQEFLNTLPNICLQKPGALETLKQFVDDYLARDAAPDAVKAVHEADRFAP